MAYHKQLQLFSALAAATQFASTQGQTGSGSMLTTAVTSLLNTVSPISLSGVTVNCNNDLRASSCCWISGSTLTLSLATTRGNRCTDGSGSTTGKFVSISGSSSHTAIFSPDHDCFSNPITQTVTARLQ